MWVVFFSPPPPSPVGRIMVRQNTHMKGYFIVCVILMCCAGILEECGEIFTIKD